MADKKEKKIVKKTTKTIAKVKPVKKSAKKSVGKKITKKTIKKTIVKKSVVKKATKKDKLTKGRYFEAIGRRKTAVARVRLYAKGDKGIIINNKPLKEYFFVSVLQEVVQSPLFIMGLQDKFKITVILKGGGMSSQAEALRHGIARAIEVYNPESRQQLKQAGFLTRDSRMRERKKPGLKRARKAPQWSKR